ncbi:MAG: hypothetical protein O3A00_15340 [Planctomycetota bacterium]|nr:hypothetical protein [Planctomycetota bacterium]
MSGSTIANSSTDDSRRLPIERERIGSGGAWLFSAPIDLGVFGGSAVISLLALWVGDWLGILHRDSPAWTWVTAVLLIDVAHVYSTAFRTYFDRDEFRRRRWLYVLTPALTFGLGVAIHSESSHVFWRIVAYMAVFHFVRQQYGWVALYRSRAGESDRVGRWVDSSAVYLATIYPLVHWHAHMPKQFEWLIQDDFGQLPVIAEQIVRPIYWCVLATYALRSITRFATQRFWNVGKDLVVFTTAVCWYVGIITFDSDYAFTVTNVIIHGVPYFALVFLYQQRKSARDAAGDSTTRTRRSVVARRLFLFMATVWVLAYVEELLWDRAVWHERDWLFGDFTISGWESCWVALLVVPQVTHYVLDGFIWKRRSNPEMGRIA